MLTNTSRCSTCCAANVYIFVYILIGDLIVPLKQVLRRHCNFIASSLEVVGCGSNEAVYSGLNEPVACKTVMIKSAQNLHSHDKTLSRECVMPFPRAPPRKTRSANNKRRKCAILTDSPEKAAIEQHTMKQKKGGRPKAKQPIKQAKR